jgi:hypothetical protein
MRLVVVLSTIALVVTAGAQAAPTRGTLSGLVMRGPVTPVCVAEQPCDEPAANVTLVFTRNGATAGRAATDRFGHYKVRLPAGWYAIRRAFAGSPDRRLRPNRTRVYAGRVTLVDLSIDTGIR